MRESLIAFIKSVQVVAIADTPNQLRHHVEIGDKNHGQMWFGYGYFPPDKVLMWPVSGEQEVMSVEDGVDAFLKAHGLTG